MIRRTVLVAMALATALSAQPRAASMPWWENPLASGLMLTETQRIRIQEIVRDYRDVLSGLRAEVEEAEAALEEVFNSDAVDQRRGTAAIDRLARTRAELTRAVSEMTLKLRAVLTPQQWQELQRRGGQSPGRGGRGPSRRRLPKETGIPQATSSKH